MAFDTAQKKGLIPTHKIYSQPFSIFAKKSHKLSIDSMKDLKGLRVAYIEDIAVLKNLLPKYQNEFELVGVKTPFEGFNKVLNDKVDLFIDFTLNGNYLIKKNFLLELESVYIIENIQVDSVSAVVANKPLLHSIITKALNTISYNEILKITKKWTIEYTDVRKIDELLSAKEKIYLDKLKKIRVSVEKD